MKISELKQPYRRMAEYLSERNNKTNDLEDAFSWITISYPFWNYVNLGKCPPITSELKRKFPADFDFSEEIYNDSGERIGLIVDLNTMEKKTKEDSETYYKKLTENYFDSAFGVELSKDYQLNMSKRYTQLAKEGKFDELPDTCEFSEPVELVVFGFTNKKIQGKFKGFYVDIDWKYHEKARIPTPKIDFSVFKSGDVVEVETKSQGFFIGYFSEEREKTIDISYVKNEREGLYPIIKKNIKSITKIK